MRITEPFIQSLGFKTNNFNITKNYYHQYFIKDNIQIVYDPLEDTWDIIYRDLSMKTLATCKTNNQEIFKSFVSFCESISQLRENEIEEDL